MCINAQILLNETSDCQLQVHIHTQIDMPIHVLRINAFCTRLLNNELIPR